MQGRRSRWQIKANPCVKACGTYHSQPLPRGASGRDCAQHLSSRLRTLTLETLSIATRALMGQTKKRYSHGRDAPKRFVSSPRAPARLRRDVRGSVSPAAPRPPVQPIKRAGRQHHRRHARAATRNLRPVTMTPPEIPHHWAYTASQTVAAVHAHGECLDACSDEWMLEFETEVTPGRVERPVPGGFKRRTDSRVVVRVLTHGRDLVGILERPCSARRWRPAPLTLASEHLRCHGRFAGPAFERALAELQARQPPAS